MALSETMAVVPMLGLLPLGQAPAGSLPSEAKVLRLVWGHVPDFNGFRGIGTRCEVVGFLQ
jgi:hypothetical protein